MEVERNVETRAAQAETSLSDFSFAPSKWQLLQIQQIVR